MKSCLVTFYCVVAIGGNAYAHRVFMESFDDFANHYQPMTDKERITYREKAREMFTFGYDNYMKFAYPLDELDPIHCLGRGHDYYDLNNININDVLGDYSLTLVDALDTLVILGNITEFHSAVRRVIESVSFDRDITVQVFEATIRILGSLLSTHILLTEPEARIYGLDVRMKDYNNELLEMAHDLASRLLPAFDKTPSGIPLPRVNLGGYDALNQDNVTCTAGAGSLLLEFGVLSRLLGDPTYEMLARRTNKAIYEARDSTTGLLGNLINVQTGQWAGFMSGLGAGIDSFYEYLLKAYILFGHVEDYRMFNISYSTIRDHMRVGRPRCTEGAGDPPLYINVHTKDGTVVNTWIDSLQASFAGVQILSGDLDEAICQHALYYSIWRKYGALPERFNWKLKAPDVAFYPLRPEFAESTYLLYMATRNSFYLRVGAQIIDSLNKHTRTQCGYATVHDVATGELEDRMESFFLSETCKYLFLLFDELNPLNVNYHKWIFTTEGHPLPIIDKMRQQPTFYDDDGPEVESIFESAKPSNRRIKNTGKSFVNTVTKDHRMPANISRLAADEGQCLAPNPNERHVLPLRSQYLMQLFDMVGFDWRATGLYSKFV